MKNIKKVVLNAKLVKLRRKYFFNKNKVDRLENLDKRQSLSKLDEENNIEVISSKFGEDDSIEVISSKSYVHRAYILQALAGGSLDAIKVNEFSNDMILTKQAIEKIKCAKESFDVATPLILDCKDSGSTLRFILPILGVLGIEATILIEESLSKRPMKIFEEELKRNGMSIYKELFSKREELKKIENYKEKEHKKGEVSTNIYKLNVKGKLEAGTFILKGNVSSQYISGLLMALPMLKEDSKIILTSKLESKGYVDLTIEMLSKFGIEIIEQIGNKGFFEYTILGNQKSQKVNNFFIEGDWSNGSFMLVAILLAKQKNKVLNDFFISGLNLTSLQKDREIIEVLEKFKICIDYKYENDKVLLSPFLNKEEIVKDKIRIKNIRNSNIIRKIDGSQIPDIIPVIALLGAVFDGVTHIYNINRLRYKESDRIKAIEYVLKSFDIEVEVFEDALIIKGKDILELNQDLIGLSAKTQEIGYKKIAENEDRLILSGFNDHRIIMMEAILSVAFNKKIVIKGWEAINKSYPNFFNQLSRLNIDTFILE